MDGFKSARGLGGAARATCKQVIRITLAYCKHGDDMMLLLYWKHGWPLISGGVGGGPFANKMIRITLPYNKHGDGMMLLLYCKHGWPKQI